MKSSLRRKLATELLTTMDTKVTPTINHTTSARKKVLVYLNMHKAVTQKQFCAFDYFLARS